MKNTLSTGEKAIFLFKGRPESLTKTALGTIRYAAPEIDDNAPYDFKVDVWSTGCVAYEFINLKYAFDGVRDKEVINKLFTLIAYMFTIRSATSGSQLAVGLR